MKTIKPCDEELLTPAELAIQLKVRVRTIYELAKRNAVPHVRINHKILRFRLDEVRKAIAEHYYVPAKPLPRRWHPKRKKEVVAQ